MDLKKEIGNLIGLVMKFLPAIGVISGGIAGGLLGRMDIVVRMAVGLIALSSALIILAVAASKFSAAVMNLRRGLKLFELFVSIVLLSLLAVITASLVNIILLVLTLTIPIGLAAIGLAVIIVSLSLLGIFVSAIGSIFLSLAFWNSLTRTF